MSAPNSDIAVGVDGKEDAVTEQTNVVHGVDLQDWSQTGRSFHVDFGPDEEVPLERGKLLGMGPYGSIYASTVESIPLTLRLIEARSRVAREHIRHEIDILKRISHNHVVQLVGSYTQRSEFGLLIYPRALCNLRTFLEQVENYCSRPSSDNTSNALLDQLNYSSAPNSQYRATPAYQRIGCILSAVAYLHESNIKHNDIKPRNILISRSGTWLSGFALAQDFSDPEDNVNPPLSFTRRYCAPEVASQEACGRSADIFSLGCVFLEILTIHEKGNLQGLVSDRSEYTAYHQQLNKIDTWLSNSLESMLTASVIRAMLCSVPRARPSAKDVLIILAEQDAQRSSDAPSMFMSCCKSPHTLLSRVGPSQPKLNNIPVTTPWSQSSQSRPAPSIFDSDTRNKESYLTSFGTSTGPKNAEHECLDDGHANVVGPTLSVISTENPLLLEYIRIFADRLATEIQNDEQSAATALPGVSDLSKIVKVFAARLHEESTNPFEWETSATILRHSKHIINVLTDNGDSDTHALSEASEFHDTPMRPIFVKEHKVVAQSIDGLEQHPESGELEYPEPEVAAPKVQLPQLTSYEAFVPNTNAYRWLLSKLHPRNCKSPNSLDVMDEIGSKVLESLERQDLPRKLSRWEPTSVLTMEFDLKWKLKEYVDHLSFSGLSPTKNLDFWEHALCLTGSWSEAKAVTVAEYIPRVWPGTGDHLLTLVYNLIRAPEGSQCSYALPGLSGSEIIASILPNDLWSISVTGGPYLVSDVAEQIAWLAATLRLSPQNDTLVGIRPRIESITTNAPSKANPRNKIRGLCRLAFVEETAAKTISNTNGSCWIRLFPGSILVCGYPTSPRTVQRTGLEISLEAMASLVQSTQVVQYEHRLMMKGFSSLLIATLIGSGVVLWHAIVNSKADERISYFDSRVDEVEINHESVPTLRGLANVRHIIGWCSDAKDFCGHPEIDPNISRSGLPHSPSFTRIDRLYVEAGLYVIGGMNIRVNQKERLTQLGRATDYPSRLDWVSEQFVALYDAEAHRAWLVNGASALLHLVRISLHMDETKPRSVYDWKYDKNKLREDWDDITGCEAAKNTLKNWTNYALPVYVKNQYGEFSTFGERIEKISGNLEILIDVQVWLANQDGINISHELDSRKGISGFDILDLLSLEPIGRRIARFDTRGDGWYDLLPEIGVVTIFGNGFGQLIRPETPSRVCSEWQSIPKGGGYLISTVSTLKHLYDKCFHGRYPITAVMSWRSPKKQLDVCECVGKQPASDQQHYDPAKFMVSRAFLQNWRLQDSTPVDVSSLPAQGAVVFANLSRTGQRIWAKDGDGRKLSPHNAASSSASDTTDGGSAIPLGSMGASTTTHSATSTAATDLSNNTVSPENTGTAQAGALKGKRKRDRVKDRVIGFFTN